MKPRKPAHKPNHIPRRARASVAIIGLLILQFAVMAGANGLVYLPGKRSEVMLSGLPTLLIVIASLGLAAALYVSAPLMEHLMPSVSRTLAWHVGWFDLHPQAVSRLMAAYPPEWHPGTKTFMIAVGGIVLGGLLSKLHPSAQTSRWFAGLVGASFALLGGAWLTHLLVDISSGRLTSAHGKTWMLWSSADPARFQALAATYLTLALFAFCLGLLLAVGACFWSAPRQPGNQRIE